MNNLRQSRRSIKMNLVTGLHEWIMYDISRLPLPNLKVAISISSIGTSCVWLIPIDLEAQLPLVC